MSNLMLGIVLGLWSGISMVLNLSGLGVRTALITGLISGLCVGNIDAGMQMGATMTLMSIGFYTYGGATVPDVITGTIFGTVVSAKTGSYDAGLVVANGIALLMTQMDILGRGTTTVFQHMGDNALAKNSIPAFERSVLMGTLPWILARLVPVFCGMLLMDQIEALTNFATSMVGVQKGLAVVGGLLPAAGFALLMSYMDIKKYWPFMIIGYVLYAYCGVGTIGLALVGAAAAFLFVNGTHPEGA
ncbi:MAG: PTS sugar transporter subunit IIC [Erysipelotrichaceae bacterium]|mgnify:FL=1|nr:PTS sugar transporter subunit IIC [Erysipelotrichaceae bacterium]